MNTPLSENLKKRVHLGGVIADLR